MKSLDTNILIRFLVRDDENQAYKVKKLLEKAEKEGISFFITIPVILELIYVLSSVYNYSKKEILNAIESMIAMQIFIFENITVIQNLIIVGRKTKFDLEDLLIGIIAQESGCETTITFDKKASKSDLFELL